MSRTALFGLLALCALVRLPLLGINEAEYTDGILQLTQFDRQTGIWPPLYTALTWPLAQVIGPLWSGRFVSTLFSILALIPIARFAERSHGAQAALWAGLLYAVMPAAIRWSPRVMTEATFTFLFWLGCWQALALAKSADEREARRALLGVCIAGALAGLTRYQGLLLGPIALLAVALPGVRKHLRLTHCWPLALFLVVPLWVRLAGTIHGEQFASRSGGTLESTLYVLVGNIEPFLLLTPYYLTYPVAVLALFGLVRLTHRPQAEAVALVLVVGGTLLIVQSVFASFQERYLLPWYGLLLPFAGAAVHWMVSGAAKAQRAWVAYSLVGLTVAWCLGVAGAVLLGSRQAFGDLKRATVRAAEIAPPGARLFTNEFYRLEPDGTPVIVADKVRFFAGDREVRYLTPDVLRGESARPGDLFILSDAYASEAFLSTLRNRYNLQFVEAHHAVLRPVFADLMSEPGTAQNPRAWMYRYDRQVFTTEIHRVLPGPQR